MFRKRKHYTPEFNLPTPINPVTGEYATLRGFGEPPYCAMMQIAAEDTHRDYVLCRGFDTRIKKFIDYEDGDANKPGIAVAKPYGTRILSHYRIAQVFPAFLPLWHIGQNPGVPEVVNDVGWGLGGHPDDLVYEIEHLKDDNDVYINWMLIDTGATAIVELCLAEDHPGQGVPFDAHFGVWDSAAGDGITTPVGTGGWDYDSCSITVKAIDYRYDVPTPDEGAKGLFTPRPSDTYDVIYECISLDCSADDECCPP